jgi:hypothetical protein
MPNTEPPDQPVGPLTIVELPTGSVLFRVFSRRYGPLSFNPTAQTNPYRGGRFDSPDGSYSYLYAANSDRAAIAETLLRHAPIESTKGRILPASQIDGQGIVQIQIARSLQLIDLSGPGLHGVGQYDSWLTTCESCFYPQTRHWALAIRKWEPDIHGFRWRPRHDNSGYAYVLFGDRTPADALLKKRSRYSSSLSGRKIFDGALDVYGVVILDK